jgi:CRP-like cAMP-binding protein
MADDTTRPRGQEPLVRKLESIAQLTPTDKDALRTLPIRVTTVSQHSEVIREGDAPSECCLIITGFLYRYRTLRNGTRQILAIHVPGDIPDLQSLHLDVVDHSVGALEASTVAFVAHSALAAVAKQHPGIAVALWKDALIDAAIYREWLVGLGRRSAHVRVAHLMCECFAKLRAVGLTNGASCRFPVTQTDLGDALGLSTVHVNRVLQDLRRDGLISFKGKVLTIPDWDALRRAGDFDPAYLHLREDRAA